tara:strand:+ start:46 stop:285 length:240 start_codon:yes stop_codon:yes gene_type:complete
MYKIYSIPGEDHTLGNLLQKQLLLNPNVQFAGYSMKSPNVEIRIQTNTNTTPNKALEKATKELQEILRILSKDFKILKY